jgi:hypothetical protein
MISPAALDTAEKTVSTWAQMVSGLPLQDHVREMIEEQLRYLPLTKQFVEVSAKSRPKKPPQDRETRERKSRAANSRILR